MLWKPKFKLSSSNITNTNHFHWTSPCSHEIKGGACDSLRVNLVWFLVELPKVLKKPTKIFWLGGGASPDVQLLSGFRTYCFRLITLDSQLQIYYFRLQATETLKAAVCAFYSHYSGACAADRVIALAERVPSARYRAGDKLSSSRGNLHFIRQFNLCGGQLVCNRTFSSGFVDEWMRRLSFRSVSLKRHSGWSGDQLRSFKLFKIWWTNLIWDSIEQLSTEKWERSVPVSVCVPTVTSWSKSPSPPHLIFVLMSSRQNEIIGFLDFQSASQRPEGWKCGRSAGGGHRSFEQQSAVDQFGTDVRTIVERLAKQPAECKQPSILVFTNPANIRFLGRQRSATFDWNHPEQPVRCDRKLLTSRRGELGHLRQPVGCACRLHGTASTQPSGQIFQLQWSTERNADRCAPVQAVHPAAADRQCAAKQFIIRVSEPTAGRQFVSCGRQSEQSDEQSEQFGQPVPNPHVQRIVSSARLLPNQSIELIQPI